MKLIDSVKRLKWYEKIIWFISVMVILISFLAFKNKEYLTLAASLIGVTALIFVAKGDVLGQFLTVVFAIFYAIVSYKFRYWGEMIAYLGMTAPIAAGAVVTWIKNPYQKGEVRVRHTNPQIWSILIIMSIAVTTLFYFILRFFHTPNLFVSTVSITTSFMAASLTFLRSSYYALFYAANDVVLISLWILAATTDISYLPMVLCFIMFLINDSYGFINWQRMKKKQE